MGSCQVTVHVFWLKRRERQNLFGWRERDGLSSQKGESPIDKKFNVTIRLLGFKAMTRGRGKIREEKQVETERLNKTASFKKTFNMAKNSTTLLKLQFLPLTAIFSQS